MEQNTIGRSSEVSLSSFKAIFFNWNQISNSHLDKGSQFGEFEYLKGITMKNDIVTVIPTLLISINRSHLNEVPPEDEQLMLNNTDVPQSDEEIMNIYLENKYWKRYKNIVVKNVLTHKTQLRHTKKSLAREEELRNIPTQPFFNFLSQNGCYVFSGSGINFPELIKPPKSPYERPEEEKLVGFGTSFKSMKYKRKNANLSIKSRTNLRSSARNYRAEREQVKMPQLNQRSKISHMWKKRGPSKVSMNNPG